MTGPNIGAIRKMEEDFGHELQHMQCLLHTLELPYQAIMIHFDGTTSGPTSFEGPIGKMLQTDVWKLKVFSFKPIQGPDLNIPDDVVKKLSRDLQLLVRLYDIVKTGNVELDVVVSVIGPLFHARWNTNCAHCLRYYISCSKPTAALQKIVTFIMEVYVPSWV